MSSQQDKETQAPKPSIADKCNISMPGNDIELVTDIESLTDSVCRIVGAKTGHADIPITSADELAKLLSDIRKELPENSDTQIVINTLDIAIELAFLHSPVYQEAFEIFSLDLTGEIRHASSAYEVIHKALLSVCGKQRGK
jgi:hypothetical protein